MIEFQLKAPALYANLGRIRRRVYAVKSRLNASIYRSAEPVSFADLDKGAFSGATGGARWGRKLSCAWLRLWGEMPEGLAGPVLLVQMNGEGLVYTPSGETVDGLTAVWAQGDVRRSGGRLLPLELGDICTGGQIECYVDCGYNGFMLNDIGCGGFGGAFVAERDAEAFAYYYDYLTLLLLFSSTQDAQKKAALPSALRASFARFANGDTAGARAALAGHLAAESETELTFRAVGHGHLDLAWMWPVRESVRKSARTYAMALKNIERYPGYIYGTSQPQQLQWMKQRHPDLYARVKQAILSGRIELQGGFWAECDCNLTGGESLVRQAIYGKRFAREEFALDMRMCWLPDAFGFNGNLPQILRGCGMAYFSTIKLAWNRVNVFPYRTFRWQGIDGTQVLVHMPPEGDYNSAAGPHSILKAVRRYPERDLGTALLVYGAGDGGGGPRESHLELLRREQNLAGLPRVEYSTAIAFFDTLREKEISHIHAGELYLETHQGTYTTQAQNKRYNRLMERLLHDAEALAALRAGQEPYPHAFFEEIWKETLLYQFHDILPGSSIGRVYTESRAGYARMEERLNAYIAQSLPAGDAPAAVNLTSFHRKEYVRHGGAWYRAQVPSYAAAKLTPFEGAKHLFYTDTTMTNGILTLTFNGYGEIVSCREKDGRELADGPLNRLTLYRDKFMVPFNAWDIDPQYDKKRSRRLRACEVRTAIDGPRVVRSQVYRTKKSVIRQDVILEQGSDVVRFETEVDWHETLRMLRADFYPADYGDTADFEIQFGALSRPTTERDCVEAAQFEVCAHKWAAVRKGSRGFALLNDCKYGHRAKNGLLSLNLLRSAVYPDKHADRGAHAFTYAFCPLGADNARAVEEGFRLNHPLLSGNIAPFASIAAVDAGVVLETVKQSEDGRAVVLRLYEALGKETRTGLATRIRYEQARFSDLLENPGEEADLANLHFCPYEIKTIRLEGGLI